jgi:CBS domain-containing protein
VSRKSPRPRTEIIEIDRAAAASGLPRSTGTRVEGDFMTVREIMSEPVVTCGPETTLSAAARLMRDADYGTLPVTDGRGNLIGIVTDRDICLAIAGSARNAAHITVHEVMTRKPVTAAITDTVHAGLAAIA